MPENQNGSGRAYRLHRRGLLGGLALVGVGALAACSSGGASSTGSSSDQSAATAVSRVSGGLSAQASAVKAGTPTLIKMTDEYKFDPASATIPVGATVTWENDGTMVHSATFDPAKATNRADVSLPSGVEPFDSGLLQPKQTWAHTFTVAGTYKYFCIPHEALGMKGEITVQ